MTRTSCQPQLQQTHEHRVETAEKSAEPTGSTLTGDAVADADPAG